MGSSHIDLTRYRTDAGARVALVKAQTRRNQKYIAVLMMDGRLRVRRAPVSEQRYMQPMDGSLRRAVRVFRHYGREHGIGRPAKRFLREAAHG